jgi:hypothetical protein
MAKPKLPDKNNATKEDYLKFLKWGINHNTSARRGHFVVWERCRLYVVGEQWLEDNESDWASRLGFSPALKPRQVDDKSWYPMPVQNEMCAPIQNEVSRLMGAGSKPYIRPSRSDSRRVKAAELSKEVLNNRLQQLGWVSIQHRAINNCVTYGTMILKSWWELDFTDMVTLPGANVQACPDCGAMISNPQVPVAKAASFLDANPLKAAAIQMPPPNTGGETATIVACLSCESTNPLVPMQPSAAQAQQVDQRGMPLGDQVPRGDTQITVVPTYDFFPENAGIGLEPRDVTEWFEERIESLEWIRRHYMNGFKVKAEVNMDIGRYHPCVGSAAGFVNVDKKDGLFENHAVLREFHQKPVVVVDDQGNPTINKGRSIVMANNEVLLDDDYMIESKENPGVLIPRVVYAIVPWEIRDREVWGVAACEYMFSLQDTINTTLSQVQDARHRTGSPKILATEGMDLQFAGFSDTGYDGDIYYYKPDGSNNKPEPFGNVQMPQNWVTEVNMAQQAISKAVGTMDVEVGQAPGKDLTAASAIMYLGEKAAERRKPRVARIKEAFCKIYRHQLELMHEFYREDRVYSAYGKNDRWVVRSFTGADLMGETDVQFDDESYFDVRMFRREVIKDGIQMGTIQLDTADAKRKVNKELGIPLEINEEQNQQVESAEEEWFEFFEEMTDPAMSQRSDDPIIHYQVHELSLRSEDGRRMQTDCKFSEVELQMWGWEDKLNAIESIEQQLKQPPPMAPTPGPGPDGAPEQGALDPLSVEKYQQALATRAQMETQIQQFPKAPELRVYMIWQQMLEPIFGSTPQPAPGEVVDPLAQARWPQILRVLRWKAHIEAHFREAQKRAAQAQAGVPVPAAPGSAETKAGLVPSPGQVAYAGAGAGPGATTGSGSGGA